MNTHSTTARSLAGTLMFCLAGLMACQSPPQGVLAPTTEATQTFTAAAVMPAPQAPFDTTPISPVESAGAAAD